MCSEYYTACCISPWLACKLGSVIRCSVHTAHCTLHTAHCTLHLAYCMYCPNHHFYGLVQPLTRVFIPQHEPSEAWGGPCSRHHNGSGFTIATVGPGPLLLLMLQIHTRQLSHWEGRPRLRDTRLERMAHPFGVAEPGPLLFPCKSIDWTKVFCVASSGPGSSQPFQGLNHSGARSRAHPIVAVVQCDWTTVCCFGLVRK